MKSLMHGIYNLLRKGFHHWRVGTIVYVFQLLLGLLLGAQVYHVLEASLGHSLSLQQLLDGYNHTVWTDFLKVHGASVTPLLGQLRWVLLLYFVLSVFLEAGAMYAITMRKPKRAERETLEGDPLGKSPWLLFWEGGARYFGRFMKISLVFLLVTAIFSALIWLPILRNLESWLENSPSEIPVIWSVICATIFYLLVLAILYIWSVQSKLHCINADNSNGIWQSIKSGWTSYCKHPILQIFMVLFYAMLAIIFIWMAVTFETILTPLNGISVWAVVGMQQLSIWLRMVLRMGLYETLETYQQSR